MKCSYCFSEIPDGSRFCTHCGGPQDVAESTATENTVSEPTPEDPTREKKRSSILTFGILSMIFSLGTSIPFVGTILAIIGKVKSSGYKKAFGDLDGKAKVGSILSTVALIAGILMTIYLVINFTVYYNAISDLFSDLFGDLPDSLPDEGFDVVM